MRRPHRDERGGLNGSTVRVASLGDAEQAERKLSRIRSAAPNFVKVVAHPLQNVAVIPVRDFPFDFGEGEMHDVVMVNLFSREPFAQFQPDSVQELDLFWR